MCTMPRSQVRRVVEECPTHRSIRAPLTSPRAGECGARTQELGGGGGARLRRPVVECGEGETLSRASMKATTHVDSPATPNAGLPLPRAARAHVSAANPLAAHLTRARASTALGKTAGAQPRRGEHLRVGASKSVLAPAAGAARVREKWGDATRERVLCWCDAC